jgi:Spy/CpxP family protein refolding chaperone
MKHSASLALSILSMFVLLLGAAARTTAVAQIPADRNGLLKGEQMGQAAYAEANGYPDPRKVLAAAKGLQLTPDQQQTLVLLVKQTDQRAMELGKKIVAVEEEIAGAFSAGMVAEPSVLETTNQIALLRGKLRALHLNSFIKTKSLLTPEQITQYKKLAVPVKNSPKK